MDVHSALADTATTDTGKIGLTARLERKTAVHDVIPAVPLRHASGIHRADKVAKTLLDRHTNLLSADAVHLRNGEVGKLSGHASDAPPQFVLRQGLVLVSVDGDEALR